MIETVAAYLTILDVVTRAVKQRWWTQRWWTLGRPEAELKRLNPADGGEARKIMESTLSRSLDAEQFAIVQSDLRHLEPVSLCLDRLLSESNLSAPVSYATFLEDISTEIACQLDTNKAFDLFGRHLYHGSCILPFRRTWSSIRFRSPFSRKLHLTLLLRGLAHLVRMPDRSIGPRTHFYCLAIYTDLSKREPDRVNLRSQNQFQFSLCGDGRLVKGYVAFSDSDAEAKPGQPAVAVCRLYQVDFLRMFRCLLLDYLYWMDLVSKERQAAGENVRRIRADLLG